MTHVTKAKWKRILSITLGAGLLEMFLFPLVDGHWALRVFGGGLFFGLTSTGILLAFDAFVSRRWFRRLPAWAALLSDTLVTMVIITSLLLATTWFFNLGFDLQASMGSFEPLERQDFQVGVGITFVVILCFRLFLLINSLIGKGVLFNFLVGRYHRSRETEQVFLFLDLRSSTTLAEKLGDRHRRRGHRHLAVGLLSDGPGIGNRPQGNRVSGRRDERHRPARSRLCDLWARTLGQR